MKITPVTENCKRNYGLRSHVCFGISPFNSYFSETRIQELASWGKQEFSTMHFFVPDVPSAYTLEAIGYDSDKAAWKARRQSQYLQNKIQRALANAGFSQSDTNDMILNWEKLTKNDAYLESYSKVLNEFESNLVFQEACIQASKWVMEKKVPDVDVLSEETLRSAARYLLTEIPLFIDTAAIVGAESSVFCYHQRVQFIEDLFNQRFPYSVSKKQGFLVLEATTEVVSTFSVAEVIA